jgi:hypothetical protein
MDADGHGGRHGGLAVMGLEAAGERRTQVVTRIVDGGSYMRRYLVGGINYISQLPSQHGWKL